MSARRTSHTGRPVRHGFTLAELVIVVLILAIISALAVPQYASATARFNADAAARRIKADLEFARHEARKAGTSQSLVFDDAAETYSSPTIKNPDHPAQRYSVDLRKYPYSATLDSVNCGGDTTLVFNGFGMPDSSATIVVTVGDYTRTVVVEPSAGKVVIQ